MPDTVDLSEAAASSPGASFRAHRSAHMLGLPLALWFFLLVQAVAWVVTPALLNSAPVLNTAEIGMWGHEWFWVNYKHPALPSWSMALAYGVFGVRDWVPFFVSQVFICATYVFVFLLGRDLLGERRALAGTLLLAGLTFFTLAGLKFNHNIAQFPFWAAFAFGLWRASETNKLSWWAFAAAIAALGLYAKFSSAIPIAFGCAWIVGDPRTRAHLRSAAPFLALALFLLMMAPLAYELVRINFLPFKWVSDESEGKGLSTVQFMLGQLPVIAGFVLLAVASGFLRRRKAIAPGAIDQGAIDQDDTAQDAASGEAVPGDRRRLMYLLVMGAGPLVLIELMSVFAKLRVDWLMPAFNFSGMLLVAACPRAAVTRRRLQRLTLMAMTVSVAVAAGYGGWTLYGLYHHKKPTVGLYPMAVISDRFQALWQTKTDHPLRIVGGDHLAASLVGLPAPEAPLLFAHLDPIMSSPTLTPARVAHDGVLVLWRTDTGWQPTPEMLAGHDHGTESFSWSPNPDAHPIEIGWFIIPPQS